MKYISYNIGNQDLPDIYIPSPSGSGIYIRQIPLAHVITYTYIHTYIYIYIKTYDSELRGQEEAGHMRQMSVLFTSNTAVKFVNALNKPPLKLSLNYQ